MRATPRPRAPATITHDGAPDDAPAAFADDWAETNRYALVSEIGRGGGGRVAVAVDRKLGRRVALKRPLDADGAARLEREAFVLARLQHPSIVPLHDAGRDRDGSPFYTMKLVDGDTLAVRIGAAATFGERLALLRMVTAVADAMAYAHAQGVVHRDLKPGNVVVGEFGEVAVIDWGLGKLVGETDTSEPGAEVASGDLTGHGSLVGTPAYMAPEQATTPYVDTRADVYAIGAILYHVLTGKLPYDSDDPLPLLVAGPPLAVDVREPRVPGDLAAIVGKAMARDPAQRYASAAELADDLHRYQDGRLVAAHRYTLAARAWRWTRRHQQKLAIGLAALALAGAATFAATRTPGVSCDGVDAPARAAWNAQIAAPIERAFAETKLPNAAATWKIVSAALDARAGAIATMRVSACRATHVTGEQSEATLDLRMACLDRRTAELRGYVTWLGTAPVKRAVDALATLGRVEDCADVERLRDLMPLPSDPAKRATIAAIEHDLDAARDIGRDGNYAGADAALPGIVKRAADAGYEPLHARALYERAKLLQLQTKTPETIAMLAQALFAAERAGDDRLRADILALQIGVELNTLGHADVAAQLVEQVRAIAERVHDDSIAVIALGYRSQIHLQRGEIDDGIHDAEQALSLIADPDSPAGWTTLQRLGNALDDAHRSKEAEKVFDRLIASRRAVTGDADDPNMAIALENLAIVYSSEGDIARASDTMAKAIAIFDRTLPADARPRMKAHSVFATMAEMQGRFADARAEFAAQLPIAEAKLGHDHAQVADLVFRIAETHEHEHDLETALAGYRDALARYTAANLPGDVARCNGHIGSVLIVLGRTSDALAAFQLALDETTAMRGADSPEAARWRGDIGRTDLALRDWTGAKANLERSLAVLDTGVDLVDRGLFRFYLAEAEWELGNKERAKTIASESRELLGKAGRDGQTNLAELDAWEKARR